MPAATSPPPPPFQGAIEASNGILVTREVEQTFEPEDPDWDPQDKYPLSYCRANYTTSKRFLILDDSEEEIKLDLGIIPISSNSSRHQDVLGKSVTPQLSLTRDECDLVFNDSCIKPRPRPTQNETLSKDQRGRTETREGSNVTRLAHEDTPGTLKHAESKPLRLRHSFWAAVSAIVLSASIFRYLESSSACKILLLSTCGELFSLFNVYIRHSPHRLDRQFLLTHASLSFSKLILTCVLYFVDRSGLIGIGGSLAFSALIICGLQGALSLTYRLVAQSTEHDVQDLKKALDVDVESGAHDLKLGRQDLRKGSLAELHSEFDYRSYTLVRLSNLGNHKREEIFVKLDKVGRLHEVSSALELPDESWEMVVLKPYLPELEIRLGEIFPGCHFDPIYDPTEPSREDVERHFVAAKNSKLPVESREMVEDVKRCHTAAKILRIDASSSRAMAVIREGSWPVAAAYYSCLLERNMTWLKENAVEPRRNVVG